MEWELRLWYLAQNPSPELSCLQNYVALSVFKAEFSRDREPCNLGGGPPCVILCRRPVSPLNKIVPSLLMGHKKLLSPLTPSINSVCSFRGMRNCLLSLSYSWVGGHLYRPPLCVNTVDWTRLIPVLHKLEASTNSSLCHWIERDLVICPS